MEEDNTIVITKKNRRLLGFLGVEHEYLVIPPEVLSRGKIRRVEAIGENAFRCSTLERVVLLDGVRSIERQAFFESPLAAGGRAAAYHSVHRSRSLPELRSTEAHIDPGGSNRAKCLFVPRVCRPGRR